MARDTENQIDMTYLSADMADKRGVIHRDLIAHSLRWSHVIGSLRPQHPVRLLDAGCGREAPLAKAMYSNRQTTHSYLGVDYGPIECDMRFAGKFIPTFWSYKDISTLTPAEVTERLGGLADVVVSFEVMEHMAPDRVAASLLAFKEVTTDEADLYLSTPCYDAHTGAAANHINEMTYETFGALLEAAGFIIVNRYGTFASQRDYKKALRAKYGEVGERIFEDLKGYYDSNLVAILWAPLFPSRSRNVMWHVKKRRGLRGLTEFDLEVLYDRDPAIRGQYVGEEAWEKARELLGVADLSEVTHDRPKQLALW